MDYTYLNINKVLALIEVYYKRSFNYHLNITKHWFSRISSDAKMVCNEKKMFDQNKYACKANVKTF